MKIIKQSHEILHVTPNILQRIESAGRTAYKSEDRITPDSAESFVKMITRTGHHSVLRFGSIEVKLITDRGVSHEIVRHSVGFDFCQESTRYCNYSKDKFGQEITVVEPVFFALGTYKYKRWEVSMEDAEASYIALLDDGASAQEARTVLPNSLKTEIRMNGNVQAWRHFFKLRTSKAAHPQLRALTTGLLVDLQSRVPVLFDDIPYPRRQGNGPSEEIE